MSYSKEQWKYKQAVNNRSKDQEEDCIIYSKDEKGEFLHIAETFQYQNDNNNKTDGTSIVNAHRLCQCVNNFDELLGACKELHKELKGLWLLLAKKGAYPKTIDIKTELLDKTEQAIAKATTPLKNITRR